MSYDAYIKQFSPKTHATISRKIRKFARFCDGHIDWRVYRTENEIHEFHAIARKLSVRTYQEKLNIGLPDSDTFKEKIGMLARNNSARGYIVFHGEKPVAYIFFRVSDNVALYEYLGYDPDYRSLSVGTIMLWYAIKDLFEERRYSFIDFIEGYNQQKDIFSTGSVQCTNAFFLRRNLANMAYIVLHYAVNRLVELVGKLLESFGLKARVNRLLSVKNVLRTRTDME